jgi:hypothetical protein
MRYAGYILSTVLAVGAVSQGGVRLALQSPASPVLTAAGADASRGLPEFIYTVRAYGGAGFDDLQRRSGRQGWICPGIGGLHLGSHIEQATTCGNGSPPMSRWTSWQVRAQVIAFLICPKSPGLPWDETVSRCEPST